MRLQVLSAADVCRALPMREAVEAMKRAYAQLSTGQADVPLRVPLPVPAHDGVTLFMPAYLAADDAMAVKIVSVFDGNPARGLPLIHALVVVVDAATGQPAAIMDGTALTALRTGAASGAATDLLARPEARVAAVFGAGAQGRTQLEAVCAVRPIELAWIYDAAPQRAAAYAGEMGTSLGLRVQVAASPAQALQEADVICTATTSATPVFDDAEVRPGTHVNAVGAYTPHMQEVPAPTVARARIVVDSRSACLAEAGDLLIPIAKGLMGPDAIYAELGEIAAGLLPGRASTDEITLFKSVGVAVQDVAAAQAALAAAGRLGLGSTVEL